jgi:hypothetical protein
MEIFRNVVLTGQVEQDIPIWENKIYLENPLLCDGDGPSQNIENGLHNFMLSRFECLKHSGLLCL